MNKTIVNPLVEHISFSKDGLVPAIIQDCNDRAVLMLAYMNAESFSLTVSSGYTHFFSRSRQRLWKKGEESGNLQRVKEIRLDCDNDTLLVSVEQVNNTACHTGSRSCFFNLVDTVKNEIKVEKETSTGQMSAGSLEFLVSLYRLILQRKSELPENSYVASLFKGGKDRILKKVVEEAGEVMLASKNDDREEIIYEMADLWFHSLLTLGWHDIAPAEIINELRKRDE